jgi:hypothetical protein
MSYSGSLLLNRDDGHSGAIIDLSYAPSLAAIQIFAATCHDMTTAKIESASFVETAVLSGFPVTEGEIYDLEYAAHFKFRRVNPTNDINFRNFRLPAPKMAIFDQIENVGYRIKQSYGASMAAALSTLWGESLTFDSGWLVH